MKKQKVDTGLDFEIDKLTNSIENIVSGDSFPTEVSIFTQPDLKNITKTKKWEFDWRFEYRQPEREVYKLSIVNNQQILESVKLDIEQRFRVNLDIQKLENHLASVELEAKSVTVS